MSSYGLTKHLILSHVYFHFQSLWTNSQLHGKDVIMWRISSLSVNKRKELIFCGMGMSHGSGCPICWQPPSTLCKYLFHYPFNPKYQKKILLRRTLHMYKCRSTEKLQHCYLWLLCKIFVWGVFHEFFASEKMCVKDIFGNLEIFRLFSRLSGICENLKVMEENWWSDVITSPTNLLKERKIIEHQSPLKLLFSIKIAHLGIQVWSLDYNLFKIFSFCSPI